MPLNNRSGLPRMIRTGNPGLNANTFAGIARPAYGEERMTLQGTVNKAFLLLVVLLAGAFWTWSQYLTGNAAAVTLPMTLGALAGFVLALIISFRPTAAPYLSLPYAACEGLFLGGVSAMFERRYPGIAIQTVGLTFGVLAALLIAYKSGLIKVTQRFVAIVVAGTLAIGLMYLVVTLLNVFHVATPLIWGPSPLSLGISVVIMLFAALNLVLDFAMIDAGVSQGAPRFMEWYSAFGLLVTLVWLYLEILRFLGNARQR
jgi:uncharacterized YccA/Bax inhibitor family protein